FTGVPSHAQNMERVARTRGIHSCKSSHCRVAACFVALLSPLRVIRPPGCSAVGAIAIRIEINRVVEKDIIIVVVIIELESRASECAAEKVGRGTEEGRWIICRPIVELIGQG